MYYRRGPIGLVLLSILVLITGMFIGYATGLIDNFIYAIFVIFGSPWLSKKIYIYFKTEENKDKIINQKVEETKKDFLEKKEVRKSLYDLLVSYKMKMVKTIDEKALKEINDEYKIIKEIYDKLIDAYIKEYDLQYQCSECHNPLKITEKKCPFCGADTE